MPTISIYLNSKLYRKIEELSPGKPSKIVQLAIEKYLGVKPIKKLGARTSRAVRD